MLENNSVVDVGNVTIYQNNQSILKDINFSIKKGEFVFLIGKTGSGKSSLLKTLYADLNSFEGNIQVANYYFKKLERKDIPFLRRKIGIVFQNFELFYDRTVGENLRFVMKATGWTNNTKIQKRVSELLMNVGLVNAENKMPHQLSGGEQQRIVIARAMINEPQIMFADEPTGNLDPEVSEDIFKLLLKINNSGTAIFMATHNYNIVKKFPKRVLKCENKTILELIPKKI